jgi:hypothetical protein
MENLVGTETSIAIRGSSGKLGSLVKQSLELASINSISINRETKYSQIKNPMFILDFAGPNPKNEQYWESFCLTKILDEYLEFLDWVKDTQSFYIRIGSYGEFSSNLTKYEYVSKEISSVVNKYLTNSAVNGCILYPSNIYGRKSLRNFVEVAIETYFRTETLNILNEDKMINPIHFEDLVRFLVDLVRNLQTSHATYSNIALISGSLYSVSTINEYVANQVANFDICRELQQEMIDEFSLRDSNPKSIKLEILPNRLKNYIDTEVKNELECHSHVL